MCTIKKSLLVLMLWCCVVSILDAQPLERIEVRDAVGRKAVCNDGSPGVYYFQPGFGDGARRWVIMLMGGGFCADYACIGRHPNLMSSLGWPEQLWEFTQGLLSSDANANPDFYNANHIFIPYCSSDLWSGNRLETRGVRPIQFRGRRIFRFVVNDLLQNSSLHLSEPGAEILFAGVSAGGIGVMVNLDWLAQRLPQAKVRGLNDAGWLPAQSSPSVLQLEEEIARGIPLWQGMPDHSCNQANQTSKTKCYLSTVLPYITTPLFIQESQRDPLFAAAQPKVFAEALRDSLVPVRAAFSPRTRTHGISVIEELLTVKVNGYSLAHLLGNWFFDRAGPVKAVTTPNSQFGEVLAVAR